MCGVVGIINLENVAQKLYLALKAGLQHRGQDAAGIATFDGKNSHLIKDLGLVDDVFNEENLKTLNGFVGVGHTRYPTAGDSRAQDAQPFVFDEPNILLSANGNITNNLLLLGDLLSSNLPFKSIAVTDMQENAKGKKAQYCLNACDGEVMAAVLSKTFRDKNITKPDAQEIFDALKEFYSVVNPSFSVASVIGDKLVAFRDGYGIRPLIFGEKGQGIEKSYMVASESAALNILGYKVIRDVRPGEAIIFERGKDPASMQIVEGNGAYCIFEYIYFARPDSVIDGLSVYKARQNLGAQLAREWMKKGINVDVVFPVPDSARIAATSFHAESGIPLEEGFIKNRYVGGRTFIAPEKLRKLMLSIKLMPIEEVVRDKRVLVIDDSIVRGSTARQNLKLLWDAGAREVHMAIHSSPILHSCYYGINTHRDSNFIATGKSNEDIAKIINATTLTYLSYTGMLQAVGLKNPCTACFSGDYPTNIASIN